MSERLTYRELQTLRGCAGEAAPSPWGAAKAATLEALYGKACLTAVIGGQVTARGRAALEDARNGTGYFTYD